MDISPAIIDHLFVSLIPWMVGMVVGGGIGVLGGLALSYLAADRPSLFKLLRLSPWRTAILIGFLFATSPAIKEYTVLGQGATQTSIALAIALLALPLTSGMLLDRRYSSPLIGRFLAQARTLALFAIGLTTYAGPLFDGGGVPILLPRSDLPLLDGLLALAALSLLVDVGLGLLQNLTARQLQPS